MASPRWVGLAILSVGSVVAAGVAIYLRMNAAYGPLNLTVHPGDWVVLWDLLVHGQISTRVLLESAVAGAVAGGCAWLLGTAARRRWR